MEEQNHFTINPPLVQNFDATAVCKIVIYALILGFTFYRNESENIKKVVEDVTDLLGKTDLFVAEHPVGVEARIQDVI